MSQRLDRVVADLDKEIADVEAHLHKLREARRHAVSARDASQRTVSSKPAPASTSSAEKLNGSENRSENGYEPIDAALRRIMANGEPWAVSAAHAALTAVGRQASKATVNAALNRNSAPNGYFERVGHGLYRLRVRPVQPTEEERLPQ